MTRPRRPSPSPALVVGYLRASTDRQDLSPDAQREALARWCEAHGAQLVAVHEDLGVSGAAPLDERPGLLAAIEALGACGAGVLLVAKRDRLARDVVVAAMVERLVERGGARVLAADGAGNGDGPEAALLRGIVDVFAQYERAVIRARTRAALAVKRSRQERTGSVPYGSRLADDGVHLVPDLEELRTIARVRELRDEGTSYRRIATKLTEEGARPRGRSWDPKTVHRIAGAA